MAEAVYILCAVTSVLCSILLLRGWRASRSRLLFWSSLCFAGFALNNVLLFLDLVVASQVDLSSVRAATAFAGVAIFIFGLVWDSK